MSAEDCSLNTCLSSSGISWDDRCEDESDTHLHQLLETIDQIVFFGAEVPKQLDTELAQECLVWRQKFATKIQMSEGKTSEKRPSKLKSLSAPKTNVKLGLQPRSLSEQTLMVPNIRLNSIGGEVTDQKVKSNGLNRYFTTNQKPVILPPIHNGGSHAKRVDQQISPNISIPTVPKVPNINKIFAKPAAVLSIDQMLCRPKYTGDNRPSNASHVNQRYKPIFPKINNQLNDNCLRNYKY